MPAYQLTLILAFALGMAELATGAFLFLGMAAGALCVALTQWLLGDFSLNRDLLIFAIISVVGFVVARRFFSKPDDQTKAQGDINQY